MNGKIVIVLALMGMGASGAANSALQDGSDAAVAPVQLPPTRLAEGGKLGDKYISGQAGGRYASGAGPHLLNG